MSKISDSMLTTIAGGYSTGGLAKRTARAIYRVTRLLLASRTLGDVSIFAAVHAGPQGRFVVPVIGKWAISFAMADDGGPDDLRLEKIGKTWPEKTSHSLRRKGQGKS